MSSEHPAPPAPQSLASSESTLEQNDGVNMDGNAVKRTAFEPTTSETRTDVVSEPDDHDEGSDSHVHSEEENDGIWVIDRTDEAVDFFEGLALDTTVCQLSSYLILFRTLM